MDVDPQAWSFTITLPFDMSISILSALSSQQKNAVGNGQ
jgi:hypothetical protein